MATKTKQPVESASTPAPAIDNEFPAYRAISRLAVASFLLGLLGMLAFVDITFVIAGIVAIITGVFATRRIQRLPEVLTGNMLAQMGIALGVIFTLASLTTVGMQNYFRQTEATAFAKQYAEVLKKRGLSQCLWYKLRPDERASIPLETASEHFQKSMADPMVFEQFSGPVKDVKARLDSSPDQRIEFVSLEGHDVRGLTPVAQALFKLEGTPTEQFPNKTEYTLVSLAGVSKEHGIEWMVEQVLYPYTPGTSASLVHPVDDGHGHGGGGHSH